MVLQKLSQSLRVAMALMVATFSTGLLPTTAAYATENGGNESCPAGTTLLAKYNFESSVYVAESGGSDITVTGGATSGSFTVIKANTTVSAVVVKGGNGPVSAKTMTYSNVTSGDFNNTGLLNGGGQVPDISNVKICGSTTTPTPATPAGTLTVDVVCEDGSNTGTISGVVTAPVGGTATYSINGGAQSEQTVFENVPAGTYTVEMFVNGSKVNSTTVLVETCEAEQPVTPAGTLTVDVVCEDGSNTGTISGVVTAPVGGTATYSINGGAQSEQTVFENVPAGTYTVEMFVNGSKVNSTTVLVETCEAEQPPVVTCPANMAFSDTNQNGRVDEGECFKKVFVCKYVGTPGIDERLQTGDNPINPSVNAIPAGATVGAYFADGQNRSFVLALDEGQEKPSVSECPAGDSPSVCTVSNNSFMAPWMYDGETYPFADEGGVFEFKTDGLYLSTPTVDAYVYGFIDAGNTKLSNVDAMSYETLRLVQSAGFEGTLPAYLLYVDTNGTTVAGGEKYMFYEPYYNGTVTEGTWQTWDAYSNGEAKWYISGTGQTLRTWDYFVNNFPDAIVLAYGFNQGQSNAETYAAIQDMTFDCATTTFGMTGGQGGGGNQGGNNGGGQVQGDSTVKTPVTTTTTPQTLGAAVLPAVLPATGATDSPLMILAAALLAYGAAYFLQGRRLITRKEMIGA